MSRIRSRRAIIIASSAAVFVSMVFTLGYVWKRVQTLDEQPIIAGNASTTEQGSLSVEPTHELLSLETQDPLLSRKVLLSSPLMIFNRVINRSFEPVVVVAETNRMRQEYGLSELEFNEELAQSAAEKVSDMFNRQYFEHQSPEGVGPEFFIKESGYEYVSVGENLALGNFGTESELVQAWMQSQGHRENILRSQFQDIGIAIGRGVYQGRQVMIAVQHFGRPLSSCPEVDGRIKDEVTTMQPQVLSLAQVIERDSQKIEYMKKQNSYNEAEFKKLIDVHNSNVDAYNELVGLIREKIEMYNATVKNFNACLGASV